MIKIDTFTTVLPQSMIKGTASEKLQKARACNIEFYKQLLPEFKDREVKASTFTRVLRHVIGKKRIRLELENTMDLMKPFASHNMTVGKVLRGYLLGIKQDLLHNTIEQKTERTFLQQTQKIFNDLYNPKFFTRGISLINKKQNTKAFDAFMTKHIISTNSLSPEVLDKFLGKKPLEKQINLLQNIRYTILSNKNLQQGQYELDRQIEKSEHMQISKKYNFEDFQYDDKLQVLNVKLAQVLKDARAKHAEKLASKNINK